MNWPFKYVNGVQTPESVAFMARSAGETAKQPAPLTQYKRETLYEQVMSDPETEECLL